jgi:hypothetical protein
VLDGLDRFDGAFACRVAPDELLLIAPAGVLPDGVPDLLRERDPHAVAVDQTAGWTVWTLAGSDAVGAFARLSEIPPPTQRPAFVQGAIAEVPSKAIFLLDRVCILVPSSAADHMRRRVLTACRDLDPREGLPMLLALPTGASAQVMDDSVL